MVNLETKYMGLRMRNPLIVSSSGLTNSVDKIKKAEANGAGAVVLKSLFEEQINYEIGDLLKGNDYPEAEDYIRNYARENNLQTYLDLISDAKKEVAIPVFASINCITASDWTEFAQKIEKAGADGIELNINIIPVDRHTTSQELEQRYVDIVSQVKKQINIPIAVKIGYHFTNLLRMLENLSANGASGIVLFNRFYEPDIDINNMEFTTAEVFSSPGDIRHSLRWVGMLSEKTNMIDISASTGIHHDTEFIKMILAGANTVQVCSSVYKNGYGIISDIIEGLESWMQEKGFAKPDSFRGKMNYHRIKDPSIYERSQFMKYFSKHG